MKKKFKNISLVGASNTKSKALIKKIKSILSTENRNLLTEEIFDSTIGDKSKNKFIRDRIIKQSDLIIAIGGDGTILQCAKEFSIKGIPLVGINLGSLGFLSDIAPKRIPVELPQILNNDFLIDERFLLKATINSKPIGSPSLNEIVIHSGAIARMIEYELYIDEVFIYRQRADGLIITTPTGSTAYSLSGGGPIIHPSLDVVGIVPMFPHSLNNTPILINAKKNIKIKICNNKKVNTAEISFDSQENIALTKGTIVHISKYSKRITLLHPKETDFFAGCRNKLGWGKSII
jgi:NAD+ kinase